MNRRQLLTGVAVAAIFPPPKGAPMRLWLNSRELKSGEFTFKNGMITVPMLSGDERLDIQYQYPILAEKYYL